MSRPLHDVLSARPYPGRGLVAATTGDGALVVAYFVTGRSAPSRARELQRRENGDVDVVDTSEGPVDALRHYTAAAHRGLWTVVGNGDHVVPLAESLDRGDDLQTAWRDHTYEPDPPIFTPRVWVAARPGHDLLWGCARRSSRSDAGTDRVVGSAESLPPGEGLLITTYEGTADHVVVSAVPVDVATRAEGAEQLLTEVWDALGPSLRVAALAARPERLDETLRLVSARPADPA